MKTALLAILIASISTFAYGEVIYLSCKVIDKEGDANPFTVSIDKNTKKITHTRDHGYMFNADGFFSPDKISYKESKASNGLVYTDKFSINRADLSVINEFRIEVDHPTITMDPKITIKKGTCEIMKVKKGKI